MTQKLRQRYPGIVERIERSLPSDVAAQLIDEVMSKGALQDEAALPQNAQKLHDLLENNFGVLSLSETPDNVSPK